MPVTSVIIPAYRPRDLDALRASMASNADVDAEWIVVDDGSGESCAPVFADIASRGARLLTLPENRGQAAARNAGLGAARGDYIKFLDADDRLDDGHLAALLAAMSPDPMVVPFAPTRHVYPDGGFTDNLSWDGLAATSHAQLERMLWAPFLSHCGALFPRALLDGLGGYDTDLVTDEDGDLLLRALQAGARFLPVPGVRYHYLHHGGDRVSRDDDPRKCAARVRVCRKFRASYEDRGIDLPAELRPALARRLDRIALSYWTTDRTGARALLAEARALAPDYAAGDRLPLRIARSLAGPGAVVRLSRLVRALRKRRV